MGLLEVTSLAITLRNLELARLQGARATRREVREALDWVVTRQGMEGCYRGLFAPARADREDGIIPFTGERGCSIAVAVGFESARALAVWGRTQDWPAARVFAEIRNKWRTGAPRIGYYCCPVCSVGRWRALAAGRPDGWEKVVAAGLQRLAATPLCEDGRWAATPRGRSYPFYYTLLTLSELPLQEATDERRRVRPVAEALLREFRDDGPASPFRRRALEWAVGR